MRFPDLSELIHDFNYPFPKDNFVQWLETNRPSMDWFFHRQGDALLSALKFSDGKSVIIKIFPSGELECLSKSKSHVDQSFAFLHVLLNDELPYSWEDIQDLEAVRAVVDSFTGRAPIDFEGVIMDLEGETSDEMDELFEEKGVIASCFYNTKENFLNNEFILKGRNPYPCLVLSPIMHNRYYSFFEGQLNKRRGPNFSQMESCYFSFSDKTLVSFLDIFFHPYAALIGPDFFETLNFDKTSINFNPYQFLGLYTRKEENIFVKNLLGKVLETGHELELTRSLVGKTHELIKVLGFEDPSDKQTQWRVYKKAAKLILSCEPFSAYQSSVHLGHGSFYDLETKRLFRNRFQEEVKFWQKEIGDAKFDGDFKVQLPESFDPDDFIYKLDTFNRRFDQNLEVEVEKVPAEEIELAVDLANRRVEHLHFSLYWKEDKIPLPKGFDTVFRAMEEGLGSWFWEDNKDLAPRTKGEKRTNTLKLLRHAGFFHLLFQEATTNIDDKKLLHRAKELAIASVLKHPTYDDQEVSDVWAEDFGSKSSIALNRFIADFFSEDKKEHFFQSRGEFYEVDLGPIMRLFFNYLADLLRRTLDEKLYMKQRFKEFKFIEGSRRENTAVLSLKGAFEGLIMSEPTSGLRILFEGKPVEALEEEDVQSVFRIDEGKEAIDWFELHPEVFFKGRRVRKSNDLVFHGGGFVEHQGQFYLISKNALPKVKWLDYFWKRLRSKGNKKEFAFEGSIEQVPKSQTLELLAMKEAGMPIEGGKRWQTIEESFHRLKNRTPGETDLDIKNYQVPLKGFQRIGTQWMLDLISLGLGGVLADDMGLGKTIQSIGALEWLRLKRKMGHCLVVVPTSLTYNWMSEIEKFAPKIKAFNYSSQNRDKHAEFLKKNKQTVTVITYGLFARNCKYLADDAHWNLVFFDEAQNLKNIKATRTGYARKFECDAKFCLTGTPMENHFGEFYSLIDLAVPGALGPYAQFMRTFDFKASKGVSFDRLERDVEFLRLKTGPLVMRRTKEKILSELPEKSEQTLKLDFEKKQEEIYRDIAIAYNKKIKEVVDERGSAKSQLEVLSAILRLRQACSYPDALPQVDYDKEPPKIKTLTAQLEQVSQEGHKALVFTNFKSTLEAIEWKIKNIGVPCFSISGATTKAKREKILKAFEETEGSAVLAMTLKTGGVGLNLTAASYVFHVEPWWNPAAESQATDRAHRMGQKNKVQVYRYIMKDSIEEKIEVLKQRKTFAIEGLLSEKVDGLKKASYAKSGLTYEDFEYLIS